MTIDIDIFTREQAIRAIEDSFPADDLRPLARHIGRDLLAQAIEENDAKNWRAESDAVLFRYAELCQAEVRRREVNAQRNREAGL